MPRQTAAIGVDWLPYQKGVDMPADSFRRQRAVLALGAGLCASGCALAQADAPAETFEQLAAQEADRAGDPDFDSALGHAAYASGHFPRAVFAWERVLLVQPDNVAAQLALGRALFAVGDKRAALAVSPAVREQGIPVDAAVAMDQFLVSYDRADYHGASSAKGFVELAAGHDSNANVGPDSALGLGAGLPGTPAWTLAPEAQARSANFGSALLAVRGRQVLDAGWSLVGAAAVGGRRHGTQARALDNSQFDANAGVAWRRERHEFIVSGVAGAYWLDGARLRSLGGVQGEWIYRFDGFGQWGSFVQWLDMRYPGQGLRNVERSIGGVSYSLLLRNGALAYGSLYGGRESPGADGAEHFGHRLVGWQLGGQVPVLPSLALYAALSGEKRRYGAADPFFAVQRRDRQWSAALGASWVPAPNWRVTPQWLHVQNDSTMPVLQYRRRVFSVTVRREF